MFQSRCWGPATRHSRLLLQRRKRPSSAPSTQLTRRRSGMGFVWRREGVCASCTLSELLDGRPQLRPKSITATTLSALIAWRSLCPKQPFPQAHGGSCAGRTAQGPHGQGSKQQQGTRTSATDDASTPRSTLTPTEEHPPSPNAHSHAQPVNSASLLTPPPLPPQWLDW